MQGYEGDDTLPAIAPKPPTPKVWTMEVEGAGSFTIEYKKAWGDTAPMLYYVDNDCGLRAAAFGTLEDAIETINRTAPFAVAINEAVRALSIARQNADRVFIEKAVQK